MLGSSSCCEVFVFYDNPSSACKHDVIHKKEFESAAKSRMPIEIEGSIIGAD